MYVCMYACMYVGMYVNIYICIDAAICSFHKFLAGKMIL